MLEGVDDVIRELVAYICEAPECQYRIAVGSDGEGMDVVNFAVVITIHRVGRGGRFFLARTQKSNIGSMREKIQTEAWLSCDLGMLLKERAAALAEGNTILRNNIEVHIDVGEGGPTRAMIKEVVGMATGLGFDVYIKPESSAASSVADRFTSPPSIRRSIGEGELRTSYSGVI